MLEVKGLRAGYGRHAEIVHGASFALDDGEFGCIIGANGCGKTTLLKTILGVLAPLGGEVFVNGEDALRLSEKQRAMRFAYIPQTHQLPFPFLVKDMVLMGRTPHLGRFSATTKEDHRIALAALCQLSIQHLAGKTFTELSGGQQQLVLIARALAQQPDILIMDEPTASLDFGNQQLVLSRMRNLVDCGLSVLMVTHDPAHAFYCADRVIVLHQGGVVANGAPDEVITPQTMRTIYGIDVRVERVDLGSGRSGCACIPTPCAGASSTRFLKELVKRPSSGAA